MTFDCAVVGAGPAGCAAAITLARAGARVALLDRGRFPRRKACGEGLLPSAALALLALGVTPPGWALSGLRYASASGASALGRFPGAPAFGCAREELDALLVRRAAEEGVEVLEGRAVTWLSAGPGGARVQDAAGRLLSARRLIAADGAASPSLRLLGVRRRTPALRRLGTSARLAGVAGIERRVEVYLCAGGELYLTPLGPSRACLAFLSAAGLKLPWTEAVVSFPALEERLAGARLEGAVLALGPLGGEAASVEGPGWLAAGDAAGAVDPLVGDGIGLGLESGRLAAEETLAALAGAGAAGRYAARRRALLRPRRLKAAALLALGRRPVLAEAALALLARSPGAFARLLD